MKQPCVFVDRDGTLIEERHYTHELSDYAALPGAALAIARLAAAGFRIVVVTNQSGIGRGYYTPADFERFQAHLVADFAAHGAHFDATYHCPHTPDAGCGCRKPAPGMVERAATELDIDLEHSWVIGDTVHDIGLAEAVGARAILVRTGHGERDQLRVSAGTLVVADLAEAAERVLDSD